jgi:nitrogen fixation protein FixH
MQDFVYTEHALAVLGERKIEDSWVRLALQDPERKERKEDGTVDYLRPIEEFGNRYLRVAVNPRKQPATVITVFFDRRLGRKR